jgi:hypothetical protein
VGYVKLLRKPEGSIWMGPSGICRAHFTSRDKTRAERCNVLAREAETNCYVRQFVRIRLCQIGR